MTDQPFAKYEGGSLWLIRAGRYEKSTRFHVLMWWETFKARNNAEAQRYTKELHQALRAHDKAEREAV